MEKDNSWNFKGAKYLKRNVTNYVAVDSYPMDMPAYEFGRMMVGHGWFNTGYHYIVHADDNDRVETGIPSTQFADPSIHGWKDSICILVMGAVDLEEWKKYRLPFVLKKLHIALPLKD